MGIIVADAQATEAVDKSAKGYCAAAIVGDVRGGSHGAGLSRHGIAHSRTEQMETTGGPPSPNGTAPS